MTTTDKIMALHEAAANLWYITALGENMRNEAMAADAALRAAIEAALGQGEPVAWMVRDFAPSKPRLLNTLDEARALINSENGINYPVPLYAAKEAS